MAHPFAFRIARHRRGIGLLAGVVCVLAVAFALAPRALRRIDAATVPAVGIATSPSSSAASSDAAIAPVVDAALLATPEAQAYFARERFQTQARTFFAHAATLDAPTRAREALALAADVDAYEQRRVLSAGEAMTLRIGLVDATTASPSERADRVAAIVAHYEADGREREARWLAQQSADTAFVRYKARESAVVAEVLAMTQIPDGLSRDEYLRRRLEAERIAAQ